VACRATAAPGAAAPSRAITWAAWTRREDRPAGSPESGKPSSARSAADEHGAVVRAGERRRRRGAGGARRGRARLIRHWHRGDGRPQGGFGEFWPERASCQQLRRGGKSRSSAGPPARRGPAPRSSRLATARARSPPRRELGDALVAVRRHGRRLRRWRQRARRRRPRGGSRAAP
jgi:hypothetical protein